MINELTKLIIRLLSDDRVEVRESAANTLSGLLHCELILITDKLIKEFEINANHKYTKNGFKSIDPKLMAIRHSVILGLCACINSYPYEVQGDQTSRIVRDSPTLEGFVPQHASPQCGTHFSRIPEIFQTFNK